MKTEGHRGLTNSLFRGARSPGHTPRAFPVSCQQQRSSLCWGPLPARTPALARATEEHQEGTRQGLVLVHEQVRPWRGDGWVVRQMRPCLSPD